MLEKMSISLINQNTYVTIDHAYGGNQSWFRDEVFSHGDAIHFGGCGLIAMADLLLYLAQEDQEAMAKLPSLVDPQHLTKDTYRLFVENLYFNYLQPWRNPLFNPKTYRHDADFVLGIQGWQLKRALRHYFKKNNHSAKRIIFFKSRKNKEDLTALICQQLVNNKPVPLLIGPTRQMFPKALRFLGRLNEVPMEESSDKQTRTSIASHWVTVTGYYKNLLTANEYLVVSSWGKRYTLDLTAYKADDDWISGVLIIAED